MKKQLLMLILLTTLVYPWVRRWDFGYSDFYFGVECCPDGSSIAVGTTSPGFSESGDVILSKVNSEGGLIWHKWIGTDSDEYAYDIVRVNDSTYVVLGITGAYGSPLTWPIWITAYGDTLWTSTTEWFGGGIAVDATHDGGIVITGSVYGSITKFSATGEELWTRYRGSVERYNDVISIKEPPYGFVTVGYTADHAEIFKMDSAGMYEWGIPLPHPEHPTWFYNVEQIKSPAPGMPPGFIAVGHMVISGTGYVWFVARYDTSGELVWENTYSHPDFAGYSHQIAKDIVWLGNEEYQTRFAIIGETRVADSMGFSRAAWLVVISDTLEGEILWSRTYGDFWNQVPEQIKRCPNGDLVMAGYTIDSIDIYEEDLWLLRVDSLGNSVPDGISEGGAQAVPAELTLRCWPNPFNSSTTIHVEGDDIGDTKVRIYDNSGKLIVELQPSSESQNSNLYHWNAKDENGLEISSGIYYYKVMVEEEEYSGSMILIK